MARTLRVKVPVAVLVASAEAQRAKIVKAHEQAWASVTKDRERWVTAALKALDRTREDIESGKLPSISKTWGKKNKSEFEIQVSAAKPSDPDDEPNTTQVDRDLALLRACSDTELSIGTDDNFARYL